MMQVLVAYNKTFRGGQCVQIMGLSECCWEVKWTLFITYNGQLMEKGPFKYEKGSHIRARMITFRVLGSEK